MAAVVMNAATGNEASAVQDLMSTHLDSAPKIGVTVPVSAVSHAICTPTSYK
jgi:hypothetical protein